MVRLGRVARGPRLPWPFNGAVWLAVGLLVAARLPNAGGLLVAFVLIVYGVAVLGGYRFVITQARSTGRRRS